MGSQAHCVGTGSSGAGTNPRQSSLNWALTPSRAHIPPMPSSSAVVPPHGASHDHVSLLRAQCCGVSSP